MSAETVSDRTGVHYAIKLPLAACHTTGLNQTRTMKQQQRYCVPPAATLMHKVHFNPTDCGSELLQAIQFGLPLWPVVLIFPVLNKSLRAS